jgi:isopentenyldiphosphate isomerase
MDEIVDILEPPFFTATGKTKPREQAFDDGDWIGTFNLWIFSRQEEPSILYQQRSLEKSWAPGLLDLAAGGHYMAGEKLADGLREVREELGKDYRASDIAYLGRKVYVGLDASGRIRNNIVELYSFEDSSPLESYTQQVEEVNGLCFCPISELLKVHTDDTYSFKTKLVKPDGAEEEITISKASFPENWDNYHHKMAIMADRHFKGEKGLIY